MPVRLKLQPSSTASGSKTDPAARYSLPDDLLLHVRSAGKAVSITGLARKFQVEPAVIAEALETIDSWGYKFTRSKEGLRLTGIPDLLSATEIGFGLKTKRIGNQLHAYRSLKSTNDLAADLAEHGAPEGAVVTAEEQTRGRGRLGRVWHSAPENGIYVSILLRPNIRPEQAPGLSIMTALALLKAFQKCTEKPLAIKWPNDLLLDGKKVAGILTELSAERGKINHVIVGVGINVNHTRTDFPDELLESATSLRIANGRKASRVDLLREFLRQFEKAYLTYLAGGLEKSRSSLKKYSSLLGKEVTILGSGHPLHGKAVDITPGGELVLEFGGARIIVAAGEVTIAKS